MFEAAGPTALGTFMHPGPGEGDVSSPFGDPGADFTGDQTVVRFPFRLESLAEGRWATTPLPGFSWPWCGAPAARSDAERRSGFWQHVPSRAALRVQVLRWFLR